LTKTLFHLKFKALVDRFSITISTQWESTAGVECLYASLAAHKGAALHCCQFKQSAIYILFTIVNLQFTIFNLL